CTAGKGRCLLRIRKLNFERRITRGLYGLDQMAHFCAFGCQGCSTSYLPEQALALAGFDVGDEMFQLVREYIPDQQAILICIKARRMSFNVHALTAIYGYTTPKRYTSH